jgi:hypothetical protein
MAKRDPQTVGQQIEIILKKELRVSSSISWEVEGESRDTELSDYFVAFGGNLGGAQYKLTYTLPTQRSALLQIGIIFAGLTWVPGALLYYYDMASTIKSEVKFKKDDGFFGFGSKAFFYGDSNYCDKLNLNSTIIKSFSKLIFSETKYGNIKISVPALAAISPSNSGTTLTVLTLSKFGIFKPQFQSNEFLKLVSLLEDTLSKLNNE